MEDGGMGGSQNRLAKGSSKTKRFHLCGDDNRVPADTTPPKQSMLSAHTYVS